MPEQQGPGPGGGWFKTAAPEALLASGQGLGGDWWDSFACSTNFHVMMYFLCANSMLSSAIISGVLPATLTSIEDEWSLSPTAFAVAGIMYDASQLIVSIPVGLYSNEGIPKFIGAGMLIAIAGSLLSAASPAYWMFLAAQALLGIGACPLWTLAQVHIDNSIRGDLPLVPKFIAWYLMVAPLGVIIGFVLTGLLTTFLCETTEDSETTYEDCRSDRVSTTVTMTPLPPVAPEDCIGWRLGFVCTAVPLVIPSVWFLLSRRTYPDYLHEDDALLPVDGQTVLKTDRHASAAGMPCVKPGAELLKAALIKISQSPKVLLMLGGSAGQAFTVNGLLLFLPRFLERQLCIARGTAPLIVAAAVPAVSLGTYLGGVIPGKWGWGIGGQATLCWVGSFTTTVASLAFLWSESLASFVPIILFGMTFAFLSASPSVSVLERLVDEEYRGIVMAVGNITSRVLGTIPGPLVLGALLSWDGLSARAAYALLCGIGFTGSGFSYWMAWNLHRREGGAPLTGLPTAPDFARSDSMMHRIASGFGRIKSGLPSRASRLQSPPSVLLPPVLEIARVNSTSSVASSQVRPIGVDAPQATAAVSLPNSVVDVCTQSTDLDEVE